MANTLKTILINDAKGFAKSFKNSRRIIANFQNDFSRSFGKIGKRSAVVGATAAVGLGVIGYKASQAAGDIELLKLRLETAVGSAKEAGKAFKETFNLFVFSPLHLKPLIRARVLLESFGVKGTEALKNVAQAAVIMDRPIEDIAHAVGSMETRPIRRLGVEMSKQGERFEFIWRDKAGKQITSVINGIEEARMELIKIMGVKFGGGLARMAYTFPGAMSTLAGVAWAVLAQIGDGFKNSVLPSLIELNKHLIMLVTSGYFERLGREFAGVSRMAVATVRKIITAFTKMPEKSRNALTKTLAIFSAFAISAKVGLLAPMLSILGALVAATVQTGAMMTMSLMMWKPAISGAVVSIGVAIATGIAGWKIGEALEEKFAIGTKILKFGEIIGAGIKTVGAVIGAETSAVASFYGSLFGGGKMKDAMGEFSKDIKDGREMLEGIGEDLYNELVILDGNEPSGETFFDILAKNAKEDVKKISERFKAVFKDLADKSGLTDFLEEFKKLGDVKMPKMPTLEPQANNMADMAESAEKISNFLLPLRGFKITQLKEPEKTKPVTMPQIPFPDPIRDLPAVPNTMPKAFTTPMDRMLIEQQETNKLLANKGIKVNIGGSWAV
jgi:hypothetical protein